MADDDPLKGYKGLARSRLLEWGVRVWSDVRVINEAPIMVRGEVVTSGLLLYSGDEVARVEFETRTYSEYFDFLPTAVAIREAHLERIAKRGLNG